MFSRISVRRKKQARADHKSGTAGQTSNTAPGEYSFLFTVKAFVRKTIPTRTPSENRGEPTKITETQRPWADLGTSCHKDATVCSFLGPDPAAAPGHRAAAMRYGTHEIQALVPAPGGSNLRPCAKDSRAMDVTALAIQRALGHECEILRLAPAVPGYTRLCQGLPRVHWGTRTRTQPGASGGDRARPGE